MKADIKSDATRVKKAVYKTRIQVIQKEVSKQMEVPVAEMKRHTQRGRGDRARHYTQYLCKELIPNCPNEIIGYWTGNEKAFDRNTVNYGHRVIKNEISLVSQSGVLVYPEVLAEITLLRAKIEAKFQASREQTIKRCPHCGQVIL